MIRPAGSGGARERIVKFRIYVGSAQRD